MINTQRNLTRFSEDHGARAGDDELLATTSPKFQKVMEPKRYAEVGGELVEVEPTSESTKENPAWKNETRQQLWKRLHPDKVRAAQAALMRKRRAAGKG